MLENYIQWKFNDTEKKNSFYTEERERAKKTCKEYFHRWQL